MANDGDYISGFSLIYDKGEPVEFGLISKEKTERLDLWILWRVPSISSFAMGPVRIL